jgi:hypothetical protein
MMRVTAFEAVHGFNAELIAGEEPELCVRLRALGFGIERIAAEMTWHDAAMTEFGQWWKRSVRAGHAFAEGAHLHGAPPERHWTKESRRALFWGGILPTLTLLGLPLSQGRSLVLLAGYPASAARVYSYARRRGLSSKAAALYAGFVTLGKFPEFQGGMRFRLGRLARRRATLIEYK